MPEPKMNLPRHHCEKHFWEPLYLKVHIMPMSYWKLNIPVIEMCNEIPLACMRSGFGPCSALLLLGHCEERVEWQQRTRTGMRTRERQSQSVISPLCCANTASIYPRERERERTSSINRANTSSDTHLLQHKTTLITKPQSHALSQISPYACDSSRWWRPVISVLLQSCWTAFILFNHSLSVSFLLGETSLVWTCGQA